MKIKHGLATKTSIGFSVLFALKPFVDQIEALVDDTTAKWGTADKVSLISSAAILAVTAGGKFAQAVAAILRGQTDV